MRNFLKLLKSVFQRPISKIFVGIFLVMFFGGTLVLLFERVRNGPDFNNLWSALWWALVTMTTVGYGDKVPVTLGGQLVGVLVMFAGVSLVSLLTATISSIFVAQKIREGQGLEQIKLTDHIILCGWNNHSEQIIESMKRLGPVSDLRIVLINDLPEEQINNILFKYDDLQIKFVRGDYTREIVLDRANIRKARAVIVVPNLVKEDLITADEKTVLATLAIKEISSKIRVIAFILNRDNQSHLRRADVDEIVVSDEFGGYLLASNVLEPGVPQFVRQMLNPGTERNLHRRQIPKNFIDKPFQELFEYFYNDRDEIIIGLYAEEETINVLDFLSADTSALDAFIKEKLEASGHGAEHESRVSVNLKPAKDYQIRKKDWAIVIGS